jgi:hypothetical protein
MKCEKKREGGGANTEYGSMLQTDPVRSQRYGVRKQLTWKLRIHSVRRRNHQKEERWA